ncbi:MAG: AMMECR1 domain-containing protein [Acidobacteria bacterium]|nr:MAG: AMMECR1 domain-containing protein [Acidobacteriota bacterium]
MSTTVEFDVSAEHRQILLGVATETIADALRTRRPKLPELADFDAELTRPHATFVTLEDPAERLLGCIGSIQPAYPLVVDVAKNALMAAFEDPRTSGVGLREYESMSVKISVLSPLEPMSVGSLDELRSAVRPGVDGLLLDAGAHHSTLLPSVWPKVSGVDEFLEILWAKAGLVPGVWRSETVMRRYTTVEFGEKGPRDPA